MLSDLSREKIFTDDNILLKMNSTENAVNASSKFPLYTETLVQSIENINKTTSVLQTPAYSIYKLNVTPVCIVNTGEKTVKMKKDIISKPFIEDLNDTNKNVLPIKSYRQDKKLLLGEYFTYRLLSEKIQRATNFKCLRESCLNKRILPEVRVTEFIKFLEKEIMPLQLMLHEILHKCSTLGLTCSKIKSQHFALKQHTQFDKQTSNRHVFTFVFDG